MEKQPEPSASFKLLTGKESNATQPPQETFFDRPAPDGPPTPPKREIPSHLTKVVRFFQDIIADEGLLLDLCVDRAVGIVEFNYKKRVAGVDHFAEAPSPMHFLGVATPLSVELYKQVTLAIEARKEEYDVILLEAQKEMESASRPGSRILTP